MFLYRDSHFWSQKGRLFPAMCGRHGACPRLVRGRNTCECTGLSLSSRRAVGIFTYWVTGLNWNAGRASLFLWKSNSSWLLHMQHFILFPSPLLSTPHPTQPHPCVQLTWPLQVNALWCNHLLLKCFFCCCSLWTLFTERAVFETRDVNIFCILFFLY